MDRFLKQFRILIILAIAINLLIIMMDFYSMRRNLNILRKNIIELGSLIIRTIENSPRFVGGYNKMGVRALAEELAKQNSVKNLIIYDAEGNTVYQFKGESDVKMTPHSSSQVAILEKKDEIVLQKSFVLVRHGMGMMRGCAPPRDSYLQNGDMMEEKEFHLMLILSKEPILQLRKGFLRNAGFLVVAEVILVAIFIIMLNIFKRYQMVMTSLNRYEQDAQLGRLAHMLAHEIKNPLSSIKGFSEYLYDKIKDEDLANYLDKILDEIDRLNRIVNDFLAYGRELPLHKHSFFIRQLMEKNIMLLKHDIEAKQLSIELKGEDFDIYADEDKITQVLLNLLLNAIQASPEEGRIVVELYNKTITIKNDVKNPFSLDKEKLFTPFYTTKSKGSGLGLAISKKILDAHGYTIRVDNIDPFIVKIDFGTKNV